MPVTTITQDIRLYAGSPILHFDTYGEWCAADVMVKAVFDLAFESAASVSETPYAAIERDLTQSAAGQAADADTAAEDASTPDRAHEKGPDRYMQKWLDVSNGKRGLLFLNNGLYGYDAATDQVRLSLLRAPLDPANLLSDSARPVQCGRIGQGAFAFQYGIMPHQGDWKTIHAPKLGYAFNNPMIVRPVRDGFEKSGVWRDWWDSRHSAPQTAPNHFFKTLNSSSSILTVIKKAEDDHGIILRIVETFGETDCIQLQCPAPIQSALETDMLERPLPPPDAMSEPSLSINGAEIEVRMRPWEIKTIRVAVSPIVQ
jgi:alpha-mannosidase